MSEQCEIQIISGRAMAQFSAKLNWMMMDPRDNQRTANALPVGLVSLQIIHPDGSSWLYVPPFPDHWTRWERIKFLFRRRR